MPASCADLDGMDLVLTDGNGTHPMTWKGAAGSTVDDYFCVYQFTPTTSISFDGGGNCVLGSDPVSVVYEMSCYVDLGVRHMELTLGFVVANQSCPPGTTPPYQIYQRSDSHPTIGGNSTVGFSVSWPSTNAASIQDVVYDPDALEWTFPATLTVGSNFVNTPGGGGLVTVHP